MKRYTIALMLVIVGLAGVGMTSVLAAETAAGVSANPFFSAEYDLCPGATHMWYGVAAMITQRAPDLKSEEIIKEWKEGASLAEIAAAHGVDPAAIQSTIMSQTTSQLDEGVAANHMSQDKAEERQEHVLEMVTWALAVTPDAL